VLLECAISSLGAAALADALGVTSRDIERISSEGRTMTLAQQRVLAMAVLTLSDGHPDLRRRAATHLGQVRAVDEFESRATERHTFPPRVRWR
jgi:hypothetical protein